MQHTPTRNRLKKTAILLGALFVVATILWVDVTSGIWQEVVILSGLAAGLVTFLLTVLVLDRVIAKSTAKRWAPVNRLAFSEFLHALADEEKSEISRGVIVTRTLPQLAAEPHSEEYTAELHRLRELVIEERRLLTRALSRWAPFLASSGDNETVLMHIADIAMSFDDIRDATIEAESWREAPNRDALLREIDASNGHLAGLAEELRARLSSPVRVERRGAIAVSR